MDAVDNSSNVEPVADNVIIGKSNVTVATAATAALSNPTSAISTAFSDSQIGEDKTSLVDDVFAMLG
jgi:hypothetical protein